MISNSSTLATENIVDATLVIKKNVLLLQKALKTRELRFSTRVVRNLSSLKKILTLENLLSSFTELMNPTPFSLNLVSFLETFKNVPPKKKMEIEIDFQFIETTEKASNNIPEVEVYMQLLVLLWLLKEKHYSLSMQCSDDLITKTNCHLSRNFDSLSAKVYYYSSLSYELSGQLSKIKKPLLLALKNMVLQHNIEGQSTIINLLLRNYISYYLYDSALILISKTQFPEDSSNNEWARFHYYVGRIMAIRLQYNEANEHLEKALRKAPQNSAFGFQQEIQKWLVVVQILMGRIPERSIFLQKILKKSLEPYMAITLGSGQEFLPCVLILLAVRLGDMTAFSRAIEKYSIEFKNDNLYNLILRCRHNVIKTGIKLICSSYSRISFVDICKKLNLDSPETTEYIVAKAIYDNVINASINHQEKYVQIKEVQNPYYTNQPQIQFHKRIKFCMKIYEKSVKAMRFPYSNFRSELETAQERRLRQMQEKELSREMADDDDDQSL